MSIWTAKCHRSSTAKSVVVRTYAVLLIVYGLAALIYGFLRVDENDEEEITNSRTFRRFKQRSTKAWDSAQIPYNGTDWTDELAANCTRPSIEHFPGGLFGLRSLQHGALAINVVAVVYMFGSLAIVCDSYFMPALESICSVLHLSEDVAGATFMAIGGSAPELFTSIIGVFISKGDIGIGTILGSAVFNVLFVIGMCGLLAGKVFYLSCWPLTRDSCCYIVCILALIFVVMDGLVTWIESSCLLLLYMLYITLMYFNPHTERFVDRKMANCRCRQLVRGDGRAKGTGRQDVDFTELENLMEEGEESDEFEQEAVGHNMVNGNGRINHTVKRETTSNCTEDRTATNYDDGGDIASPKSPFEVPSGCLHVFTWSLTLPALLLFYVTIPDCRKKSWARWYPVTFVVALLWIGGLTYLLVWMVTVIGFTLQIPDTVMGLTLLAAGSSVPDFILSVLAAKEGYGDMAISHSIGSNIFDILLGLGLPWFLSSVAVMAGDPVVIHSQGIIYITALLLGNVIITVLLVRLNGFLMNKKLGCVLVLLYAAFLMLSIFMEMTSVIIGGKAPACP